MLVRLRAHGFKNLLNTEAYFGPFTCIAGANGAGKSNLFDAIHFLRLLTSKGLVEAAQSVRDDTGFSGNIRDLFYRGNNAFAPWMEFEADFLTPRFGEDRLRQHAEASSTLLTYKLRLGYRGESEFGPLEILHEELGYVTKGLAHERLLFPHRASDWRDHVVVANRRTAKPYIETTTDGGRRVINIRQDGTPGRPAPRLAEPLPATVLSELSAAEAPTAVVARNEINAWQLLQLEPSALRRSDYFRDPGNITSNGSHMPATLNRMIQSANKIPGGGDAIRQQVANRLAELVNDIRSVRVERDDKREMLTLLATIKDGTEHPARSLSDGTLRFLALVLIEKSSANGGAYCLEEPENGIHPLRVRAILSLLRDIAVNPELPPDDDNPLRQVIINTHSPLVVAEVNDDELIIADTGKSDASDFELGTGMPCLSLSALPNTWRTDRAGVPPCPKGRLLSYLNPIFYDQPLYREATARPVKERDDLQQLLPFPIADQSK